MSQFHNEVEDLINKLGWKQFWKELLDYIQNHLNFANIYYPYSRRKKRLERAYEKIRQLSGNLFT